jgi:hypothetical protein
MKKNVLIPYWELEEYLLGMYDKVSPNLEEYLIAKSVDLLTDPKVFFENGLQVLDIFKKSSKFHLSNQSINRNAWIGQSSCFFKNNVPEYLTRKAWVMLSFKDQSKANQVAQKIIRIYETKDKSILNQMEFSL